MLNNCFYGFGTLAISPKLSQTLFNARCSHRSERRSTITSTSQGSFSRNSTAAAVSAAATHVPSIEAAKQLTKQIKSATNPSELFDTLESQQNIASVRHLSSALHHLSKMQPLSVQAKKLKSHPDIVWIVNEILDRKEENWEDISIANVLKACHTLNLGKDFPALLAKAEAELVKPREKPWPSNWITITSLLIALAKLGRKMGTHPYLQAVQASLLKLEKKTKTNEQLNLEIQLEDFDDYWGLAWALTEVECTSDLADAVVLHVSTNIKFKILSPRQLIFITRLAAERGSPQRALQTAQDVASALTCGRWKAALKSPTPRVSARDLAMLFFNLAKLVRMAASTDLNDEMDPAVWHKMEQRVTQIDGSTPELQSAIRLLQRALVPLIETMEAHEISSVASALANMQRTKSPLIPMLAARATELAPNMDSMGLCMIARSLASLQFDSEVFIETAAIALRKLLVSSSPKRRQPTAPPPSIESLIAMLYSVAVLNRFDGPAVQKLLPELIPRLIPALSELDPIQINYLPLVGWSLIVAKGEVVSRNSTTTTITTKSARNYIIPALKAWRSAITMTGHGIPPQQLAMVQHVDVALRIECPDLGTDAPAQYDAFLNFLYNSGRLRYRAAAAWTAQIDQVLDDGDITIRTTTAGSTTDKSSSSVDIDTNGMNFQDTETEMDSNRYGYQKNGSRFQRQVYASLCQAIKPPFSSSTRFRSGSNDATSWQFEYWEQNLWYSVDAALPAYKLAIEADGPTHYSTNTLRPLGHTLLKRRLLKQLGWVVVNIPLFEWLDISVGGCESDREAYLVSKIEKALGGRKIEEFLKSLPVEAKEEIAQEKDLAANIKAIEVEDFVEEVPGDDPAVANRALRLDLIKLRQGKLSKSQLAFNAAMRKTTGTTSSIEKKENE